MAKRRRRYPWRRGRSYRKKHTIPVLPVLGTTASVLLMPRRNGAASALNELQAGRFDNAAFIALQNLTGYSAFEKEWKWENLAHGWTPILAGILGHKVAGWLGINRQFANLPSPLNKLRL